jgi:hypothetical protein
MPTLQVFSQSRVVMFFGDHPPPHVHIQLSDGRDCIVEIETRHVIGKISFREIREALNWIEIEQKFLSSEWQRCNS